MPDILEADSPEDAIKTDSQFARETYKHWRHRHDTWDAMVYPQTDDILEERYPYYQRSKQQHIKRAMSQYRTNFPYVVVQSMINHFSRAQPQPIIAIANQDQTELIRDSALENLALGILRILDDDTQAIETNSSWLRRVYAYAAHPAKMIGFPHVRRLKQGSPQVTIEWDLYEPYLCYPIYGRYTKRFVRDTYVDYYEAEGFVKDLQRSFEGREAAKSVAPFLPDAVALADTESVLMTEYWYEFRNSDGDSEVWRGILMNDALAYLNKEPFTRMPIVVVSVNALGHTYQRGDETFSDNRVRSRDYIERHAEPIFAPMENTVSLFDQVKTMEMDGIDLVVNPPIVTKAGPGRKSWVIEDERMGSAQIPLESDQFIELLRVQTDAAVANSTLVVDLKEEMFRLWPRVLLGEEAFAGQAGFHFNLQTSAAEKTLRPWSMGISTFLERGFREIFHQLEQMDDFELSVNAEAQTGEKMGHFVTQTFRKADFPNAPVMRWKMADQLPKDDFKAGQLFQMAVDPERGWFDAAEAMSQYIGITDPHSMIERREIERISNSEPEQKIKSLLKMRENLEALEEKARREEDPVEQARLAQFAGYFKGVIESLEVGMLGSAPSVQMQRDPLGVAPAQQPPEERGLENPSELRALQGITPPGGNGAMR